MSTDLWGAEDEGEGNELNLHALDKRKKLDKLGSAGRKRTRKAIVYSDQPEHPSPGFYYLYTRKPDDPVNHGAYEVIGILHNTECDVDMVAFRPLYEGKTPIQQNAYMAMPLLKFSSLVVGQGDSRMHRYRQIKDESVLSALKKIRDEMYPPPSHRLVIEPEAEIMQYLKKVASAGLLGKTPSEVVHHFLKKNQEMLGIHARLSRLD